MKGYVGTYASALGNGIYEVTFDEKNKRFLDSRLYSTDQDAKYLSYHKGSLAYPFAADNAAIKMKRDGNAFVAGREEHVSCFITQDDTYLYTANYHDGIVNRYEKTKDGIGRCETIFIQKGAGTHQVILHDRLLFVPCRMLDQVFVYDRETLTKVTTIPFPKDSGPRHGVLSTDQKELYVLSENSCEVYCITLEENFRIEKSLSLLEQGIQGGGAAIRMSEDGTFLYLSIRECNRIYVVDRASWSIVQWVDSGGDHPRDIELDPTQSFLFVANRFSHNLVAFDRDKKTGKLTKIDQLDGIIEGVSIVFEGH